MLNKFLALTALTVSLGATTAMAQTAYPQGALPAEWQGAVSDAFYSDTASETLRTDSEIRANWDALDEADRMQVRNYCATNDMGQAGATGGMQTDQAEDQALESEQMADEGATTGVASTQAEDQQGQTEQMGGGGAVVGQMSGTATDQADDQARQTEQMGEGAAPVVGGAQAASVERICDMVATM